MKMQGWRQIALFFLPILFFSACASQPTTQVTQGQIDLAEAKRYQEAGRYELAIEQYSTIKNKYPLSPEAVEAELELAETFYLEGSYPAARTGFETFIELHPRHAKVPFSAFRAAMTYYKEIPPTIDRDLAPAASAVAAFDKFLKSYSSSPHAKDDKAFKQEALKKFAEKEYYIANFYYKRKEYKAASGRFIKLLKSYPNLGYDEKALFHLGLCYYKLDNKPEAERVLNRFLTHYPKSIHVDEARQILKNI